MAASTQNGEVSSVTHIRCPHDLQELEHTQSSEVRWPNCVQRAFLANANKTFKGNVHVL